MYNPFDSEPHTSNAFPQLCVESMAVQEAAILNNRAAAPLLCFGFFSRASSQQVMLAKQESSAQVTMKAN